MDTIFVLRMMNDFIENKSLVPAPANTCPEDDESVPDAFDCANTHGRDSFARRLLPAMLKDDLSPLSLVQGKKILQLLLVQSDSHSG